MLLLSLSNAGVVVAICYGLWISSIFSSEHKILVIEIAKAREDLAKTMMFFESPFHVENTERTRKLWVEELSKAVAKDRCNINFHDTRTGNIQDSGILSQLFCFCVMSGGIIFLAKILYSEFCAFKAMKKEEIQASRGKDSHMISVAEFIQYRSKTASC